MNLIDIVETVISKNAFVGTNGMIPSPRLAVCTRGSPASVEENYSISLILIFRIDTATSWFEDIPRDIGFHW